MTTPFDRWLTTEPDPGPDCPACEGACPRCGGSGVDVPPDRFPRDTWQAAATRLAATTAFTAADWLPVVEAAAALDVSEAELTRWAAGAVTPLTILRGLEGHLTDGRDRRCRRCEPCDGNGRIEGGDTCGSCMGHGSHPVPLYLLGLDNPDVTQFVADHPNPDFPAPTPLTVDADGHVEGHITLREDELAVRAVYDTLDRLVAAILGPPPPANSCDTLSHDDYDKVHAAVLVCSHPQFTALVPDDLRGCDACNLSIVAEPLLDWGLGWATAYDTDGIPDVTICPACCLEYPDEPPLDDVDPSIHFDLDALRREEQDAIDSMDGSVTIKQGESP